MDMPASLPVPCPKCSKPGKLIEVGSASGRGHYRCEWCGTSWREKSAAAVALGKLGGIARAERLSIERRSEIALNAGMVNKRKFLQRGS